MTLNLLLYTPVYLSPLQQANALTTQTSLPPLQLKMSRCYQVLPTSLSLLLMLYFLPARYPKRLRSIVTSASSTSSAGFLPRPLGNATTAAASAVAAQEETDRGMDLLCQHCDKKNCLCFLEYLLLRICVVSGVVSLRLGKHAC